MRRWLVQLVGSLLLVAAGPGCQDDGGATADSTPGADVSDAAADSSSPPDAAGADDGATAETDGPAAPDASGGATGFPYDPVTGAQLTAFGDDFYTVDDPASPTGLRVHFGSDNAPWLDGQSEAMVGVFDELSTLDGFGTTAGIVVRFDGPLGEIPTGEVDSLASDALRLVALDGDGTARRIPFEVELTEDHTIILSPMLPLAPRTRHGVLATKALRGADGEPVTPSATLTALLAGDVSDPRLVRLVPRYEELLAACGVSADEVSAAVVFTTQTIVDDSVTIAADIAQRSYDWTVPPVCQADSGMVRCDGKFGAQNYRQDGVVIAPQAQGTYDLDMVIWLPVDAGPPPYPTVMFGHGLAHHRSVVKGMAETTTPLGAACLGIDAVSHGDHPDAPEDSAMEVFSFFEVNTDPPISMSALRLRDNFRQSTYDKLQALRLIEDHPDIDGDGQADLDTDWMAYTGESFGGIMAIELLALTDRFEAAGLQLGGGRVVSAVADSRRFGAFALLLEPEDGDLADVRRFYPVIQTIADPGDASNYAPHVFGDRLPGAGTRAPHLMLQLVIDDDTIPDTSSRSLVRALGLPHVPPVIEPAGLVEVTGAAPVAGNIANGALTAGFFQFDRVTHHEDEVPEKATHDYTPSSREAEHQLTRFLETWLAAGPPEIEDPYTELGTPALGR